MGRTAQERRRRADCPFHESLPISPEHSAAQDDFAYWGDTATWPYMRAIAALGALHTGRGDIEARFRSAVREKEYPHKAVIPIDETARDCFALPACIEKGRAARMRALQREYFMSRVIFVLGLSSIF